MYLNSCLCMYTWMQWMVASANVIERCLLNGTFIFQSVV